MQFFELHFNPRHIPSFLKKGDSPDLIFDSFCYEPESIYEKRLGSLFLAGELKNVLPQNLKFLDNLATELKKHYYSTPIKFSPEVSFKESLKKTNEFLEGLTKSGDVSWLGNLNLAVFSLTLQKKDKFEINFSKVGTIKILLVRSGQVIDIGKNLEFSEIEPYPLKVFNNIVSGKLAENDVVLILTKEVFEFFLNQDFVKEIAEIAAQQNFEAGLKEILKIRKKDFSKISGICLVCRLTKNDWSETKKPKISFAFQKEAEKFSLAQVFKPFVNKIKTLTLTFSRQTARIFQLPRGLKETFKKLPKPSGWKPKLKLPKLQRKNLILVSALVILLLLGFFIFKKEEEAKLKKYQLTLTTVSQELVKAENFLNLKAQEKAFAILKKIREELLPLTEEKTKLQKEAISLKSLIEEKLANISKLEKISDPELLFEFASTEFIPQKMAFFEENLYFCSPYSNNVYKLTAALEKIVLETNQKFNAAAIFDNSLLFFKKPNLIFFLKQGFFEGPLELKSPYPDFTPGDLNVYRSSLYFLDAKKGEIIKYPGPLNQGKDSPQTWLKQETKKAIDGKSMAVDGSIWILNKDNSVDRYYAGSFQQTLKPEIFPEPENFAKIFTLPILPYLYILEPAQNRIVILDKQGKIVKQLQSREFDSLLDFAVSQNGKTIYLLSGLKVYKINW